MKFNISFEFSFAYPKDICFCILRYFLYFFYFKTSDVFMTDDAAPTGISISTSSLKSKLFEFTRVTVHGVNFLWLKQ